jgi:hypothetical protein
MVGHQAHWIPLLIPAYRGQSTVMHDYRGHISSDGVQEYPLGSSRIICRDKRLERNAGLWVNPQLFSILRGGVLAP